MTWPAVVAAHEAQDLAWARVCQEAPESLGEALEAYAVAEGVTRAELGRLVALRWTAARGEAGEREVGQGVLEMGLEEATV